jgi:hypothetical protein
MANQDSTSSAKVNASIMFSVTATKPRQQLRLNITEPPTGAASASECRRGACKADGAESRLKMRVACRGLPGSFRQPQGAYQGSVT